MDAIELIKQDHRNVERLFTEFLETEDTEVDNREDLFQQIETELNAHTEAEEKVFYPAMQSKAPDKVQESLREHSQVKQLLAELLDLDFDEDEFPIKFNKLMEDVLHHVEEEEAEDGVLELAQQSFDSQELAKMGGEIQRVKESIEGEMAA
jgi:hemerythrin superfamily protein